MTDFIPNVDAVLRDSICDCVISDAREVGWRAKAAGHNVIYFPLRRKILKHSDGLSDDFPGILEQCIEKLEADGLWPAYMELYHFENDRRLRMDLAREKQFNVLCVDCKLKSGSRSSTRGRLFFGRKHEKVANIMVHVLRPILRLLFLIMLPFLVFPAVFILSILCIMGLIRE